RRHRDGVAGKVFVVEAGRWNGDACRRLVLIASRQCGDVVDALLLVLREYVADPARKAALVAARLSNHRHIGRDGAVARPRRLVVGKGRRGRVGGAAGAVRCLALIVGLALDLVFGGDGGRLRCGETGPTGSRERAERDQFDAVTDLADLAIDLEAALKLCAVELAERPRERPLIDGRRRRFVLLRE